MSTTTPTTRPVTALDTLPRPKISLAAWAKLWFAPEAARQHFATLGERFVMDVPLLPTMFWTRELAEAGGLCVGLGGLMPV